MRWSDIVDKRIKFFCVLKFLPLRFNYAVIDIETTGLNPKRDQMVGFGLAYNRFLLGCVRAYGEEHLIRDLARDIVFVLLRDGVEVYAWYKEFEEQWLGIRGLLELQLRPYEKKDSSISMGIDLIADGRQVPELWNRWETFRDVEALLKILWRAMYDAYVEAATLYRKRLRDHVENAQYGMTWYV